VKIEEREFLKAHENCWTAKRAPEFSVVNIHMAEIPASRERIFPELAAREMLLSGRGWRALFRLRLALGKVFGWDRGMRAHGPEPFEVGRHYGFFKIEHVDAPREVGMSVKNQLTDALLTWVLEENGASSSRVYNVTCANFHGLRGRMYWQAIRPFHDGIIEASLRKLARKLAQQVRSG
jgi:Protein of unknown function (DUF2867)